MPDLDIHPEDKAELMAVYPEASMSLALMLTHAYCLGRLRGKWDVWSKTDCPALVKTP